MRAYQRWHRRYFNTVPIRFWLVLGGVFSGIAALCLGYAWWWVPAAVPVVGGLLLSIFDPWADWT